MKSLGDTGGSDNFGILTKPVLTHPARAQRHKPHLSLCNLPFSLHTIVLSFRQGRTSHGIREKVSSRH